MDKERIIQVIKYLAQNHVGSKCWTCVSNQISLLILTPFCYNRYSEKARGGIKETKDSEQGFILSRTRRGADERRNSGSLVLCVCTRAHHTFHSPVLTGPSSRELFCQLFYNGPKVYRAGGDLTSLPLGQPEELDAQSTRPVPLTVPSASPAAASWGFVLRPFPEADMQLTETRGVCFGAHVPPACLALLA